ncbi:hypothetical protein [Sphingomonas bisphenolicum]|uniref:Uncharacterized protein n=1 Tax=Sphingomonas bisphenolicum TaxID=296544 RepID=A0ABM7G5T1_9SPHN|nr:hypothetical protein [Sphingomonas bisphenolicum]BBF70107.1 hypothetical protein SBA_ch1_23070 [Sphingomonas bisphenolicum]
MKQMANFTNEPAAWSFSEWKNLKATNNTSEYWLAATAIVLEYRSKDLAQIGETLHEKASALGYAHILMDSLSRKGERTATIVFPLTERVNKEQYARLAKVLMSELNVFHAADGNCAMTHLIHVDETCQQAVVDGAVIVPRAKIKETERLYQNMDPNYFCAGGPAAAVHIAPPVVTSHDGMFEWAPSGVEKAQMTADAVLASIGVSLPKDPIAL